MAMVTAWISRMSAKIKRTKRFQFRETIRKLKKKMVSRIFFTLSSFACLKPFFCKSDQ